MSTAADPRAGLRADCSRCVALCCVATAFGRSADFAFDKAAGEPCRELVAEFACGIHDRLRESGMPGCTAYDCFGAGQHVAQVTYAGADWRADPDGGAEMFEVFGVQRDLHELLWYLAEARSLQPSGPLHAQASGAYAEVELLTRGTPERLAEIDVRAVRTPVSDLLRRVSEVTRAVVTGRIDRSGADLTGGRLRGTDLRGSSLRGALLMGADLRDADLRLADLLGADLRGADLSGADLGTSLFLTRAQVGAARGDLRTVLPPVLEHPTHWRTGGA
jgi:uncharacterized protein YjbI with pentapeptide repeats